MKKGIEISGKLSEKGSTAHTLNVEAASKGLNLTEYIQNLLDKEADKIKKRA